MTQIPNPLPIGHCTNGPVLLSESPRLERKFVISIVEFDNSKHRHGVSCKATSKGHDKVWPGEFLIDDFFGRGKAKIQPYNIVRMPTSDFEKHRHIGALDPSHLPLFEKGLRIAIQKDIFNPAEVLRVANSWSAIFSV
jgi:hypothetical protein